MTTEEMKKYLFDKLGPVTACFEYHDYDRSMLMAELLLIFEDGQNDMKKKIKSAFRGWEVDRQFLYEIDDVIEKAGKE